MIHYTLYLLLFLFGLIIGSFLNSVIFRLPARNASRSDAGGEKGESIIWSGIRRRSDACWSDTRKGVKQEKNNHECHPERKRRISSMLMRFFGLRPQNDKKKKVIARSQCPHCQHKLSWLDLIPVFSFIFLRGKCRYCRKAISWQYPIVEISTALIFLGIINFQLPISKQFSITNFQTIFNLDFWHLNFYWILDIGFWIFIACSLIIIFVYDLRHYIIPDKILFPAIIISIMYHVSSIMQTKENASYIIHNTLYNYFGSAISASLFFFLLVFFSRGKWMGMGDAKLAFLMGLILGWPNILVALFLAFFLGAVVGVLLILISGSQTSYGSRTSVEASVGSPTSENRRFYTLKSQIPFAPFLIIGTFLALFWGSQIINWYSKIFI